MRRIESYKGCSIEIIVRPLEDRTFTAYGYIRRPDAVGMGDPYETSFQTGESHPDESTAIIDGLNFAKNKIDLLTTKKNAVTLLKHGQKESLHLP